jgi:hypothetical protein
VLQDVFQVMNIDAQWSTREGRSFEWWGYRLRQRVWAEPVNVSRAEPIVRFHAETDYIKDVPDREQTYAALGAMNEFAGLSTLYFDPSKNMIRSHTTMYLYPGNRWMDKLLKVAVASQDAEAHLAERELLGALGGGVPDLSNHPISGERTEMDGMLNILSNMPGKHNTSPFSEEVFESVLGMQPQLWVRASGGAGLTAAFPFYDAVPAVLHAGTGEGTGTALLMASGTEKSPRLGSGLLLRLCLPLVLDAEFANRLANDLNLAETREWTETHLLGSWCAKGTDVWFVCFVPAMVALGLEPAQRAILVYNLVASMGVRAKWVKDYLAPQRAGPAHTAAETQQVREWSGFTRALASSLEQLKVDQFLILDSHGYYVQFAQHGPRGLLAESVSNQFLEDFELLSPGGEKRLRELGWVEPGNDAGDRQGPSNWSKEWLQPVPYLAVADLATQTLRFVYGVSAPTELVYKASDRSGAAVFLPNLGVPRSELAKPVAPDTSKKQLISDVIGPTDVAWNLWENSTEPIGEDNVGWNLWNMSNQISFVRNLAARARERLVEGHSMEDWPAEDVAEFTRLAEAAEQAAQRATNLWEQLRAIVTSSDPSLIEPLEESVSVIHNHGNDPKLMARIGAAWGADTSRHDAQVISDKLEALLAQHGLPAIEAFRRLKQPVANDEPSPSGTQTNQTGSTGGAMDAPPTSTSPTNLPPCPSCGAQEVVPVIYGVPDSVLLPIFGSGAIRAGGAFGRLADHTGPHWYCRSCGGAWRGDLFQGSGDSPDDPVVISGVTDNAVFIRAEKMFLVERFGLSADEVKESSGWRLSQQALVRGKTGALDLLTVILASGEQREILFQLPK